MRSRFTTISTRLSVCSDVYSCHSDSARQESAGDKFSITTAYLKAGSTVHVELDISAKHEGFFEFSLCTDVRSVTPQPAEVRLYFKHYRAWRNTQRLLTKTHAKKSVVRELYKKASTFYLAARCGETEEAGCFFRCEDRKNKNYYIEAAPNVPCVCQRPESGSGNMECYDWANAYKNEYNDEALKQCFAGETGSFGGRLELEAFSANNYLQRWDGTTWVDMDAPLLECTNSSVTQSDPEWLYGDAEFL